MRALLPDLPQVAVFDTAFHQTMPPHAFRDAVPEEWYTRHGVRRYGFHGISHYADGWVMRPAVTFGLAEAAEPVLPSA